MDPEDLSDDDLMLNLEGQILNALTKHGGQVIQAGPQMESLIKDLIEDVLTHPDRRCWAAEYLRRFDDPPPPPYEDDSPGGTDG